MTKGDKLDIISYRSDEPPFVCIQVNENWLPALYAMIYPFRYPERWLGTLDENKQARADVLAILNQIMLSADCGEIMAECCTIPVTVQRLDPVTGQLQQSTDDGVTWQKSNNAPETHFIQLAPPVTTGVSATKCDAASNGLQHVEDWVSGVHTTFDNVGNVVEFIAAVILIVAGLLVFYLTGGVIAAAEVESLQGLVAFLRKVWDAGQSQWDSYWSSEEYDKILCALYCFIGEDGSFTDAGYMAALARMAATLPASAQKLLFMAWLQQIGRAGLNQLCAYGNSADADCASCDCACPTEWFIQEGFGENYVQGDDEIGHYVQCDAVYDGPRVGSYAAALVTSDKFQCCKLQVVTDTGATGGTWRFNDCSHDLPVFGSIEYSNITGIIPNTDTSINCILRSSLTPFVFRCYFSD
jgi:hypothetical protein